MIRYISKEERDMAQSILIVDDERDIVSMLNQYFCKIGYVVYTAINGKEALNAITKHPDIILLDDVGVKTINKFNPIPYSTLKNSYFVVYRRGLGNI